jgi:hypothetical protein
VGIYIYIDGSDLDDVVNPMESSISEWLTQNNVDAQLVNDKFEKTPDMEPDDFADWNFGLNLELAQKDIVPSVINFLNSLAVSHERDFVIGVWSESKGISSDISYFGFECGHPKADEILSALYAHC